MRPRRVVLVGSALLDVMAEGLRPPWRRREASDAGRKLSSMVADTRKAAGAGLPDGLDTESAVEVRNDAGSRKSE